MENSCQIEQYSRITVDLALDFLSAIYYYKEHIRVHPARRTDIPKGIQQDYMDNSPNSPKTSICTVAVSQYQGDVRAPSHLRSSFTLGDINSLVPCLSLLRSHDQPKLIKMGLSTNTFVHHKKQFFTGVFNRSLRGGDSFS